MSTSKQLNSSWTPSEDYDSSNSEQEDELANIDFFEHQIDESDNSFCQSCPLDYTKMISLKGSVPNLYASTNLTHIGILPPTCCAVYDMSHISKAHHVHENKESTRNKSNQYLELGKRQRLKNKIEREQRTRSQSDNFLRTRESPYCCSLQHFQDTQKWNKCQAKFEERLNKLENEREALHMEISVLSEQVDAQANKIQELESMLREKKDSLRRMEEALQKEVLSRSALETQKLELLSSLSEMKLRQASLEHENLALRGTSPMSNGEKFGRHTSQYSSLPRPPSSSKKGVMFGKVPSLASGVHTTVPLAIKGASARCLSAPTLAEEEKIIIEDSNSRSIQSISQKSLIELSMEEIGDWLTNLGLECYSGELRRWGATGAKLLECSQQQMEKELEIKNVLHRKKLLYAIESEKYGGAEFLGSDKMDNAAVLRWLDDIGLPQHKEAFQNGKVDGRMLHRLTTEDLLNLGVTAQLHAASLRRGIQILRELNFEFDNLERRSINGNGAEGGNVHLWTNHRVMEWLRVVDLAEYAPNMRGSGVHGGLMMYEGRFTSELLATLLSISPGKTLLRRHLTTHFNQILGREVVQRKREIESTLGFVPLTLTARLKVPKKSQFTLKRKKSKNEADYGNLVCPLDTSPPGTPSTPTSTPGSPNLNSPTF
ncbi:PREDICTED: liprin-beta-1 isoform X1 [Eufriesea mexicana]|uniref:liprin-beta-1 isoform X1 n=1 Tax=Eufriesea mexicana TaxID=516756 RepID=UPI00083C4349|nr:PREDICTED: liprin-beta-1 isoform X1 [Eufriesea mexicana]XP_017754487.1 PREDICTED: liprin-beta-1 isoform X1 [Eufriesea mexicana]